MRERVLRSLRITRRYVAADRVVLLLGATPEFPGRVFPASLCCARQARSRTQRLRSRWRTASSRRQLCGWEKAVRLWKGFGRFGKEWSLTKPLTPLRRDNDGIRAPISIAA